MTRLDRIEAELVAEERAACAALCREAGCICNELADLDKLRYGGAPVHFRGRFAGRQRTDGMGTVEIHDPRCPLALASRIEAQGVTPKE